MSANLPSWFVLCVRHSRIYHPTEWRQLPDNDVVRLDEGGPFAVHVQREVQPAGEGEPQIDVVASDRIEVDAGTGAVGPVQQNDLGDWVVALIHPEASVGINVGQLLTGQRRGAIGMLRFWISAQMYTNTHVSSSTLLSVCSPMIKSLEDCHSLYT